VGLADRADDRAGTFSGGMKRRLNLAAAVVHRPRLLFLDEPTAGVDPQSRNHIFEQVKRLNAAGTTIIYTSHYMEEVERLCKRIAILDAGKLLACDILPHLFNLLDGTIRFTASGTDADFTKAVAVMPGVKSCEPGEVWKLTVHDASAVLARLAKLAAERGIELESLSMREPTLERVFLHLTGRELRN
jgi:ABC-2 type transport system ATP-binding protein